MSVKLQSSGGGSIDLAAPSTINNRTVTLPDATTTLVGTDNAQTLTNKTLVGVTDGSSASAGQVGQYVESVVSNVSAVTSNQWGDATSITLTAGDWDISASAYWTLNGATSVTRCWHGFSTTSGNDGTGLAPADSYASASIPTASTDSSAAVPPKRVSITSTTTYYLKYNSTYSTATPKFWGRISARRVR